MPYKTSGAYYMRPTVQPVSPVKVREQLEAAKADVLQLIIYLEKVKELPDDHAHIKDAAEHHRMKLVQRERTQVDVTQAYRFMFRNADYIADRGGF